MRPIEIDARNIHFPNPSVKPLRVDITTAEQGRITLAGDLGPQGGTLDLKVNDFALAPFNPYAKTYSPYGISDGSLQIKTNAKYSGGKYDVTNAVTLHQFDLSGAEGDSLFEQQFGIPLTMALALLRDTSGDIDLNIPMQVDQSGGATVDVLAVVRSALRQAMTGAIESPLKLVGGVIGIGGKSGAIAPAPIAFPLGRAEPTAAGAESAAAAGRVSRQPSGHGGRARHGRDHRRRALAARAGAARRMAGRGVRQAVARLRHTARSARAHRRLPAGARRRPVRRALARGRRDAAAVARRAPAHRRPNSCTGSQPHGWRRCNRCCSDKGIDAARITLGEPSSDPVEGVAGREDRVPSARREVDRQQRIAKLSKGGTVMLKEFREFAMKGNVIDMAVGIIIGAAFGKIVSSFVSDILMPPLGMLIGKVDFTNWFLNLSGGDFATLKAAKDAGAITINYGAFLNNVLDFVIVAFAIFLLVKQINRLKKEAPPGSGRAAEAGSAAGRDPRPAGASVGRCGDWVCHPWWRRIKVGERHSMMLPRPARNVLVAIA